MKEKRLSNALYARFGTRGTLNKHVGTIHEGKKPFQCTICDARFGARGTLNKHVGTIHEGKNFSNAHL